MWRLASALTSAARRGHEGQHVLTSLFNSWLGTTLIQEASHGGHGGRARASFLHSSLTSGTTNGGRYSIWNVVGIGWWLHLFLSEMRPYRPAVLSSQAQRQAPRLRFQGNLVICIPRDLTRFAHVKGELCITSTFSCYNTQLPLLSKVHPGYSSYCDLLTFVSQQFVPPQTKKKIVLSR